MRIGTVLAVATTLSWSPALAEDLIVEPCHSVRLQYDTDIREVHIGDETLVAAVIPEIPEQNKRRLLIVTAKPKMTTTQVDQGNKTTTTTSTDCAEGSTTLIVLDDKGTEIFPLSPPSPRITSNNVLVRSPDPPGKIVEVGNVLYRCNPVCIRLTPEPPSPRP